MRGVNAERMSGRKVVRAGRAVERGRESLDARVQE